MAQEEFPSVKLRQLSAEENGLSRFYGNWKAKGTVYNENSR